MSDFTVTWVTSAAPRFAAALADQITLELESSIAYLQLSIALENHDLPGMARWMRLQSDEERVHAAKFTAHATDRGLAPQIGAIDSPVIDTSSVVKCFEASLAHEKKVSESIRNLYRLAQEVGEIDVIPLLHWFIDEQVEEEASVGEILGRLRLVGDDGSGLLRIDDQLGSRPGADAAAETH